MLRYLIKIFLLLAFVTLLTYGCGRKNALKGIFQQRTPYETYAHALKEAKLDETALGKEWIQEGKAVFSDSLYVTLPYSETTYFDGSHVQANSYRFIAERGQVVHVAINILSMEALTIFMDLFLMKEAPEPVASADTSNLKLQFEVEENGEYLLRIQPELLRGGRYSLSITSTPVLAFPVQGKNATSIGSSFGAARDAGARKHEGVDIFAPRGTPALAVAKGHVGRVGSNRLGGKVVWLRDPKRNFSYYYAHLDSQIVEPGKVVAIGDTLGLIGNTGNAITTPPHLHFGIYAAGQGAIDPYSFFHEKYSQATLHATGKELIGQLVRVSGSSVNYRLSPDLKSPVIKKLPEHTLLKIEGATENWLRAKTPRHLSGYIYRSLVETIHEPIDNITLDTLYQLYDNPGTKGILLANVQAGTAVRILGAAGDYYLVNTNKNVEGWIKKSMIEKRR